jgi:hypothetical protein
VVTRSSISTITAGRTTVAGYLKYRVLHELEIRKGHLVYFSYTQICNLICVGAALLYCRVHSTAMSYFGKNAITAAVNPDVAAAIAGFSTT